VAATIAFLASEGAVYITGQNVRVDGGLMRGTLNAVTVLNIPRAPPGGPSTSLPTGNYSANGAKPNSHWWSPPMRTPQRTIPTAIAPIVAPQFGAG
jgi:hypothetical protein